MEGHGRSWKVKEGQGRLRKVKEGPGWSFPITGLTFQVACRIILSAPVPFLFLWTLDFGFGTWIWDLDLGLYLGLTINSVLFLGNLVKHFHVESEHS